MSIPKSAGQASPHVTVAVTFLTRTLSILLAVVCYAFLLNVPNPPSVVLGIAYGAAAICLAVAAWRLMARTMD